VAQASKRPVSGLVLSPSLTALCDVLLSEYSREIQRGTNSAVPISVTCCRAVMLNTRVFSLEGGILLCTDFCSDEAWISVPCQYRLTRALAVAGVELPDVPCSGMR